MATFFFPQGGHCGEVQPYLNTPWRSKIIMYIYIIFAQSSISFSGWRDREQRFVSKRVGADLQVLNNRTTADIKDVMATGKRSQVARLVCLLTFIVNSLIA